MSPSTPFCVLCGYPCKEHALVIQGNDDDPDAVVEDIQKLNVASHRLHILTTQRYRQLNALRSLTRTLPNEILLSIFQFFCSLFHPTHFPQFILGGVCSHWHNLINEPRFWKSLYLTVDSETVSRSVSLLEVFKKRNAASFEFLHLKFKVLHDQTNPYQQIVSSMEGVSKLSKVALQTPPDDLLQVINHLLSPYDMCLSGPEFIGGPGPLPRFSAPSVPRLALTNLTLHRIQVDFCCELLLGCPNLTGFASYCSTHPTNGSTLPNTTHHARETHFPHLQYLTWHHEHSAWDNNLLSFYRFPALQRFCWHGVEHTHSLQLFHNFTSLLPQSCRTFHLAASQDDGAALEMELVQQIMHPIEQLICSDFYQFTLPVVLERLKDPTFSPLLTFFKWEYRGLPDWEDSTDRLTRDELIEITQSFKDVFQVRKDIGSRQFRMEIEYVRLEADISKESIYELMGGAFDFEITEGDCWIISL